MLIFFLGILGFIVGSFLNVVISRLATGEPIIRGRSHCPECAKTLTWFELLPILSFIIQKGRCRGCGQAISFRYPMVEAVSAGLFLLLGFLAIRLLLPALPFSQPLIIFDTPFQLLEFLAYAFFSVSLIAISVYDFEHLLIPRQILLPLAVGGFIIAFARWFAAGTFGELGLTIAAAASAYIFFSAIWFFSKGQAMGLGDAELALAIGLWLGPWFLILAIILAFWSGALVGVGLMIFAGLRMKSRIPFGPFLALGALVGLFWGSGIMEWYLNLL